LTVAQGLVTHGDGIVGMLIEKIPATFPGLGHVLMAKVDVPLSSRKRWAAQIEETVGELHRHGIVWGDAKPGNVIIDEHDDAWLIDFGGGYTSTWVDEPVAESVEGDLQAVGRMKLALEKE